MFWFAVTTSPVQSRADVDPLVRRSVVHRSHSRALLTAAGLAVLGLVSSCAPAVTSSATPTTQKSPVVARPSDTGRTSAETDRGFGDLESRYGARLGIYAVDTGSHRTLAYRADERFAYDSTFKALAAALLLRRDSSAQLDSVVRYDPAALVAHSPISRQHLAAGMTLRALCAAAVEYSDNTAANLMLSALGGPEGFTAALRRLGDPVTESDRAEPALDDATPGDTRDTSTPAPSARTWPLSPWATRCLPPNRPNSPRGSAGTPRARR